MRTFWKVIKITLLVFFVAIVALIVVAKVYEDRIKELAIEKLGESIDAPLGMEDVTFSLIRDFPLATIQFKGLWLGAPLNSIQAQQIDTLAKFNRLYVAVESKPLMDNIINVLEVDVDGGFLTYALDENGTSNFDFLLKTDSQNVEQDTSKGFSVTLDELSLKDFLCQYRDDKNKAKANVYIPEIEGTAKVDSITMLFTGIGGVQLKNCYLDQTHLDRMQQADIDFDLIYNADSLTFNALNIRTEGATIDASGKLTFADLLMANVSFTGDQLNLKELSKYIPEKYLEEYQLGQIDGVLDLQAKLEGVISDSLMPYYEAKFSLVNGKVKWQDYPTVRAINTSGFITNGKSRNNATTALRVDRLKLNFSGNQLDLKGSVHNLDQIHYNLRSRLEVDLERSKPLIPDTLIHHARGRASAQIETRGVLPDSLNVRFVDYLLQNSNFAIQLKDIDVELDSAMAFHQVSGQLNYRDHQFQLDSFNIDIPAYDLAFYDSHIHGSFSGRLAELDSMEFDLKDYLILSGNNLVKGNARIKNINRPTFVLQSDLDLDLPELKKFIPDSLVKDLKGSLKARVKSEGELDLDSISDQIEDLIYDKSSFDLTLEDVWLDMPDTLLNVKQLSGQVNVTPRLITVKDLKGSYSGMDFQADTAVVSDLFHTVMRDRPGKLKVEGVFRVSDLDYGRLDSFLAEDSIENQTEASINLETKQVEIDKKSKDESWNMDYEIKGKLFVNSLKYRKAVIEDISTLFNVKDSVYILDQLQFKAFGGEMNSSVRVEFETGGKTALYLRNRLKDMDIRRLLYEMEDFDRTEEFSYTNISGILTTEELYTRIKFMGDSLIYPDTRMKGDLLLEEGGIYNFGPVEMLAPSIPGIDRLDTLEFKTIDSHIFVFKDTLCVPETYLVSNKFDISTIGMQSFYMDYDYQLEVHLKEILFGSSKKRKRERAEIEGTVEKEDKKAKWVKLYTDENGDPKMKILGNAKERQLMKLAINSREFSLNLRFNPKIVSFDTGVIENTESGDSEN